MRLLMHYLRNDGHRQYRRSETDVRVGTDNYPPARSNTAGLSPRNGIPVSTGALATLLCGAARRVEGSSSRCEDIRLWGQANHEPVVDTSGGPMSRFPLGEQPAADADTGPNRRQLLKMAGTAPVPVIADRSSPPDIWTSTRTAQQTVVSPTESAHLASRAGIVHTGKKAVGAVGPLQVAFDGEGHALPYVTASGTVELTRSGGERRTLLAASGQVEPAASKTRLAIGAWAGRRSVLFVDTEFETIYRVTPDKKLSTVATPAEGARAVLGVSGAERDGGVKLVFVGTDRQLHMLAPDGSTTNIGPEAAGGIGVEPGIGAGSPAAIGADDRVMVPVVDRAGDIHLVGLEGGDQQLTTSGGVAASAPLAPVDFDGDGAIEIVYRRPDGALGYVDAASTDSSPTRIDTAPTGVDAGTGVVGVRAPLPEQERFSGTDRRTVDGLDDVLAGSSLSVAVHGATAVVGTPPQPMPQGTDSGSATVFARVGGAWTRQATLSPPFGGIDFGSTVAVEGTTVLVGAPLGSPSEERHSGSTAVYTRTAGNWSRDAILHRKTADGVDRFGGAVALGGSTAVVGASAGTTDRGFRSGTVCVFVRSEDSWDEQATLLPDEKTDQFGTAVAIDRDTIVVGGRKQQSTPKTAGVAFVFERINGKWRKQTRLEPPGGERDDEFGRAVAIDGDTVLVGAPTASSGREINAGAAYVFTRAGGSWQRQQTLGATDSIPGQFGTTVALDGDTALVGTKARAEPIIYTRESGSWTKQSRLDLGTGEAPEWTATAVALDSASALVGVAGSTPPMASSDGTIAIFDS